MEIAQSLEGNKKLIRKNIILFLLLILTQSCFQKSEKETSTSDINNIELTEPGDLIINNLKDFYTSYISKNAKNEVNNNSLENLKNKYITKNLLDKLQNLELDYDPFVNMQDYYDGWIKTLKIKKREI